MATNVSNNLMNSNKPKKMGIATYMANDLVRQNIRNVVGGANADRFCSSIVSAVQTNKQLAECTNSSIVSAALLGNSLKLSPSPQLGQYYMVPFKNKKAGTKEAQFQLGYKGYIQLAIRSGQYKRINVVAVKEGELEWFDPFNEEIHLNQIKDFEKRENTPTMGYYAMFELVNGFRKILYMSKEQMLAYADKYSQAFSKSALAKLQAGQIPERDLWKFSSFWYTNFDAMAYKTMIRQLIGKWGAMSIDMQTAFDSDMAVIKEDGSKDYVDGTGSLDDTEAIDVEATEVKEPEPQPVQEQPRQVQNGPF